VKILENDHSLLYVIRKVYQYFADKEKT